MELFGPLFIVVIVNLLLWFHFYRSNLLLQQWSDQNGYRLVQQDYCWVFRGPFFWTCSRGQVVYRVVVEDQAGTMHRGWIRCGDWWFGLLSDKTEVRWEN